MPHFPDPLELHSHLLDTLSKGWAPKALGAPPAWLCWAQPMLRVFPARIALCCIQVGLPVWVAGKAPLPRFCWMLPWWELYGGRSWSGLLPRLHALGSRLPHPSKSRWRQLGCWCFAGCHRSCTRAHWDGPGAWHWNSDWSPQCEVARLCRPLHSACDGKGSSEDLQNAFGVIFPFSWWIAPSFLLKWLIHTNIHIRFGRTLHILSQTSFFISFNMGSWRIFQNLKFCFLFN